MICKTDSLMSREILKATVLACYLQVNQATPSCFSEFPELTSPSLCTHYQYSFPRLDWTGGCVCVLIVNEIINDRILLWLFIFYFSLFVWFWIKKILISEVNFQCGSKNRKTPPHSKKQMYWQMFYLPSESVEQRRLFCNKYLAFS